MTNEYEIRGDVTVIFINRRKENCVHREISECLISTEDLSIVNQMTGRWVLNEKGYIRGNYLKKDGIKEIQILHRLIMSCPMGMEVDHINHDPLDNRRENLRVVTHRDNVRNKGVYKNAKYGVKGVSYNAERDEYLVTLYIPGFKTLEEASQVVDEIRDKYCAS